MALVAAPADEPQEARKPLLTCTPNWSTSASGIAVISWKVGDAAGASKLRVTCGDKLADFDVDRPKGWVGIHTHLLPNGPQPISLVLLDSKANVLARAVIALNVQNVSALAKKVKEESR